MWHIWACKCKMKTSKDVLFLMWHIILTYMSFSAVARTDRRCPASQPTINPPCNESKVLLEWLRRRMEAINRATFATNWKLRKQDQSRPEHRLLKSSPQSAGNTSPAGFKLCTRGAVEKYHETNLRNTGSSRKDDKSQNVCMGVNFHKSLVFSALLGSELVSRQKISRHNFVTYNLKIRPSNWRNRQKILPHIFERHFRETF